MKSILLASASVLVLAGAAQADIEWSGVATLGTNDDSYGDNDGFYWDLEIDVVLSQTLDNGLTAGAEFGFEAVDDDGDGDSGQVLEAKDFVLFLESDTAGLYFGQTAFAAETRWSSAGDMESDAFSEQDGETVLRGDIMMGGIEASISYLIADEDGLSVTDATGGTDDVDQLSIGAVGTFGNFTVGVAWQDESVAPGWGAVNADFNYDEVFGIFGSTSLGGADITLAYAETDGDSSTGIKVAYPFGPVTATFYYVDETANNGEPNMGLNVAYEDGPISVELDLQDDQGVSKWALDGSYDVGNGIVIYAGILNDNEGDEDYYLGGMMDLGSGASLLVSFAEDDDDSEEDEIGAPEFQAGTTIEVSLEF